MALGILGILIGFFIILFFTFKNVNTIILAPIAAVFVAIFNHLNPVEAFSSTYVGGVVSIIGMLLPVIMLGTILGKVYTQTGAALSLADGFIKAFVDRAKGENKVRVAVAVIVIVSFLLCLGGIDAFIVLFTTFPIVVRMWKKLNMPRKFIPGILMCSTAAAVCPGAPVVQNIVPMSILQTSPTSGLVPGIVAAAIIAIGTWATISRLCIKDMRKGIGFEYGDMPPVPEFDSGEKKPNFFIALIPIILVFVLFGVAKLDISIALSSGIILALVLMGRYITYDLPEGSPKRAMILATLNDGAMTSTGAIFSVSVIGGFAGVVAATTAFQTMAGAIVNLPIHPLLIVVIAIVILVALTSSPPAGMSIIVPILAGALLAGGTAASAGMIAPEMIHRVSTIASVSFETLPFNGMIVIILSMTKISHKEGYMPMFLCSCIYPLIGAIVAALMFMAAPGLA